MTCSRGPYLSPVQGFRVELDGVAAVMEAHPGVTKAVSLLIGTDLWGIVSPASVPIDELKTFVQHRLPYYSVPSRYFSQELFPMTRCVHPGAESLYEYFIIYMQQRQGR